MGDKDHARLVCGKSPDVGIISWLQREKSPLMGGSRLAKLADENLLRARNLESSRRRKDASRTRRPCRCIALVLYLPVIGLPRDSHEHIAYFLPWNKSSPDSPCR